MNAIQFAFFRAARQRMTPDELDMANALVEKAEAGNHAAAATFRNMCDTIVRRKREKSDGETGERK